MALALLQGGSTKTEDVFTPAVQQQLKEQSFKHAALAVGTTKQAIQELIDTAIAEGQSIQQLGKAINDTFQVNSTPRSKLIARTEVTGAINNGATATLGKEGYREKQWSTVMDGRERETHATANGQTVSIQAPFTIGGESAMYPGDSNLSIGNRANCRCTVVGAGLPEDRRLTLYQKFLRTHENLEKKFVVQLEREFERQRRRILSHFPSV